MNSASMRGDICPGSIGGCSKRNAIRKACCALMPFRPSGQWGFANSCPGPGGRFPGRLTCRPMRPPSCRNSPFGLRLFIWRRCVRSGRLVVLNGIGTVWLWPVTTPVSAIFYQRSARVVAVPFTPKSYLACLISPGGIRAKQSRMSTVSGNGTGKWSGVDDGRCFENGVRFLHRRVAVVDRRWCCCCPCCDRWHPDRST